ncbi:MAG: HAD family hydrolase [Planctomycetota bacterium]
MSGRKLIAIDLDGTLLGPDGLVSEATRDAYSQVLGAGHEVVIATGRTWYESTSVVDAIGHRGFGVFVGGAMTVDLARDAIVRRQAMDRELARSTCDVLEQHDLTPLVLQDREAAGVDYVFGPRPVPKDVLHWNARNDMKTRRVDDLAELDHVHTMRIGTLGPQRQTDAARAELDRLHAGDIVTCQIDLATYGVELLEVFDRTVNKWAGVSHIADKLGIKHGDVIAIGDDMNDLPMIEAAGLGVAMGNAKEPVQRAADRIIDTHANDGLAEFLRELVG